MTEFYRVGLEYIKPTRIHEIGKIMATLVLGYIAINCNSASGNLALGAITAIWIVTVPALVEAFFIAKNRRLNWFQEEEQDLEERRAEVMARESERSPDGGNTVTDLTEHDNSNDMSNYTDLDELDNE